MENQYEEELNLSAMLLSICLKWRVLLIVAAVAALVVGGTKLAMNIQSIRDPEAVEKAQQVYEDKMTGYEAEGQALQLQMSENRRNLALQTDYMEKSMLMKINPRNEWRGSINLYIDTNYQIMPGSTYQNENPAYKIICAYYDYYNSGEFFTTVMDSLSFDMGELRYLKEVLGVTFDTSRYAVTVNVVADSQEHCEELVRTAKDAFQLRYGFIRNTIGEHTLTASDAVAYTQINSDREAFQAEQEAKQSALLQKVPELNQAYQEWEEKLGEIEVPLTDMRGAVRGGIKWIVIAAAAGFFLSAVFFFLRYILSGRVREAGNLGANAGVLAELPTRESGRKRKNRLDRLICRIFGVSVRESEYDSRVEAMAVSIDKMLRAQDCEKGTIAFVGDVEEAELQSLTGQVAKTLSGAYKAVAAGNMVVDTAAARCAYEADAVVLVVKQNVSLRKTYEQFREKLAACKVQALGTVLLGVESI